MPRSLSGSGSQTPFWGLWYEIAPSGPTLIGLDEWWNDPSAMTNEGAGPSGVRTSQAPTMGWLASGASWAARVPANRAMPTPPPARPARVVRRETDRAE